MKIVLEVTALTQNDLQKAIEDLSYMVLNFDKDTKGGGTWGMEDTQTDYPEYIGYQYEFTLDN